MAKPIRPTPTLRGKEAIRFAREMLKEQKSPSKVRVSAIKRALKSFGYFGEQMKSNGPLSRHTDHAL